MKNPPPRVTAAEAIASIREYTGEGVRVLGVDGFTIVPEGFRADLDLIFDASERSTFKEAASATEAFINEHGRSDVVWEVWADD